MKRSYHTDICLQFKFGMLDKEIIRDLTNFLEIPNDHWTSEYEMVIEEVK